MKLIVNLDGLKGVKMKTKHNWLWYVFAVIFGLALAILLFGNCNEITTITKVIYPTPEYVLNEDGLELRFCTPDSCTGWFFIPAKIDSVFIVESKIDTVIIPGRIDTVLLVPSDNYTVEWDDIMGCNRLLIDKSTFFFSWEHNGFDIEGNPEKSVSFQVGIDWFDSHEDLMDWKSAGTKWYGYFYAKTDFNEFESGRNKFIMNLSDLPAGKFIVASVMAIDAANNQSEWTRSTDSLLTKEPFYIYREK